jgi:hypothetical protein
MLSMGMDTVLLMRVIDHPVGYFFLCFLYLLSVCILDIFNILLKEKVGVVNIIPISILPLSRKQKNRLSENYYA